MLLSLTVFQQSVSEAMPITSLQIPLLGNLVVKLYTKNTKEIGRYNNHLIVHSRQNLFSTLYCIYRFVKKKLYLSPYDLIFFSDHTAITQHLFKNVTSMQNLHCLHFLVSYYRMWTYLRILTNLMTTINMGIIIGAKLPLLLSLYP